VYIRGVGEVVALVDSGASVTTIRRSVIGNLNAQRNTGKNIYLRGIEVCVEESVKLNVRWKEEFETIDEVAVVHSLPFPLILGVDWVLKAGVCIVALDGELIVETFYSVCESFREGVESELRKGIDIDINRGERVNKEDQDVVELNDISVDLNHVESMMCNDVEHFESNGEELDIVDLNLNLQERKDGHGEGIAELKDVAGNRFVCCKPSWEDEGEPYVSDEFLDLVKRELPYKRRSGQYLARIAAAVEIPPETLVFVQASVPAHLTDSAVICGARGSRPGEEWVVPSSVVRIRRGKVKVPILNLTNEPIRLKRRDFFVTLDIDTPREVSVVKSPESHLSCFSSGEEVSEAVNAHLGEKLTPNERVEVMKLLWRRRKCFPRSSGDIGCTTTAEHVIDTGDASAIRTVPYRVSAFERRVITEKVDEMLKDRIIRPSFSPWASPVVLVKKKSGDHRFCVDYRRLNDVTKRDQYPLPLIDDVFDRLAGSRYFSSLDLASGYWQVPVAAKDQEKTAFVTSDGLYEFLRLPFGLSNAPATFSRLMDRVLGCLKWQMCLVYLDDILVFGKTFKEYQERLDLVLAALEEANLTLNPSKCVFATHEIFHLGHIVDAEGLRPNVAKVAALKDMRITNPKSVRAFLGLASYYRRFLPDFAAQAAPLHSLLRKNAPWSWGPGQEEARNRLVEGLISAPVLAHFDENLVVTIQTDASGSGLGAVMSQDNGEGPRPVAFISRSLIGAETRYHANELVFGCGVGPKEIEDLHIRTAFHSPDG